MSGEFQLDFGIEAPDAPTVLTAAVTQSEPGTWPTVVIRVTGMEESEFGARMTADMLRDWADAIEARLPDQIIPDGMEEGDSPSNPESPQLVGGQGGSVLGDAMRRYNAAAERAGSDVRFPNPERFDKPLTGNPERDRPTIGMQPAKVQVVPAVRPTIETYKTPERVLKNREKRAERKRFNPRKAD